MAATRMPKAINAARRNRLPHWRLHPPLIVPSLHSTSLSTRSGIVLVPQLIPKLVRRIEPPLKCEEFARSRVSTKKLILRRMELVRKVVRAAEAQGGVNQFACPDSDLCLRG